jgi:CRISPR type IV-associated protein Csf3
MKPFKVTFKFMAPVLRDSEYPIHLDSLIAYLNMKELETFGDENPWQSSNNLSFVLDKTDGDDWVWKASALTFVPAAARMFSNMIRKSEPEQYLDDLLSGFWKGGRDSVEYGVNPDTFTIDTRSGQQRGYQWLTAFQWIESAVAWGVGDIDEARRLLSGFNCLGEKCGNGIEYLGKKGGNGFGRISEVIVEEACEDEADNWMLRVLPLGSTGKDGILYEPVQACLRAPYWRKTNRVMALEPLI